VGSSPTVRTKTYKDYIIKTSLIPEDILTRIDNDSVKFDEQETTLVSGFSSALLKSILGADFTEFTPMNMMLKVVMNEN
jgi:hypothetical protein